MTATHSLAEHSFVVGLAPHILAELAALVARREFAPGEVIFREGSECDDLFLISHGHVAIDVQVPGRGPVRILTLGQGELLGWSALLGSGPMTATATVVEPTTAFSIPGKRIRSVCERNHEVGYRIMQQTALTLAHRLTATRVQMLDLFAHPNEQLASP
ncbi:MAG: cyclic nucleotide-binding domain-containing protein [Planctomycetes bacterium]|nr:cyclic nucleotide-binding domain-containing protein [Planctomycetota bacterium]